MKRKAYEIVAKRSNGDVRYACVTTFDLIFSRKAYIIFLLTFHAHARTILVAFQKILYYIAASQTKGFIIFVFFSFFKIFSQYTKDVYIYLCMLECVICVLWLCKFVPFLVRLNEERVHEKSFFSPLLLLSIPFLFDFIFNICFSFACSLFHCSYRIVITAKGIEKKKHIIKRLMQRVS